MDTGATYLMLRRVQSCYFNRNRHVLRVLGMGYKTFILPRITKSQISSRYFDCDLSANVASNDGSFCLMKFSWVIIKIAFKIFGNLKLGVFAKL